MFPASITRTLRASFAMFPIVFKTHEKLCRRFRSKQVLKRHFFILKFIMDAVNWYLDLASYDSGSNRASRRAGSGCFFIHERLVHFLSWLTIAGKFDRANVDLT